MMKKFYIWFFSVALLSVQAIGQPFEELIKDAYLMYESKDYFDAEAAINQAIDTRKGQMSELAWHIRGFIYKDIFVEIHKGSIGSTARPQAVKSLFKSMELDEHKVLYDNNYLALKYLGVSYFNDASDVLRERNPEKVGTAESYYSMYRDIMLKLHPDTAIQETDILFYLSLATAYRKIYDSNREKYDKFWFLTNETLKKVIDIDPDNFPALYSLGVSYYNRGAQNLDKLPEADDIADAMKIQGESIRSIKVALPFMLKAYEINPENIETVKGLKWIHFNLDNPEQYEKLEKRHKELQGLQR